MIVVQNDKKLQISFTTTLYWKKNDLEHHIHYILLHVR